VEMLAKIVYRSHNISIREAENWTEFTKFLVVFTNFTPVFFAFFKINGMAQGPVRI